MININSKTHALAFKCRGAQKLRKIRWKHWVFPLAVSFLFKKIQEKTIYFGVCKTLRVTQPCSQLLATTCEQKNIQEYIYFGHTRLTSHPKTLGPESWDIPDIKCLPEKMIFFYCKLWNYNNSKHLKHVAHFGVTFHNATAHHFACWFSGACGNGTPISNQCYGISRREHFAQCHRRTGKYRGLVVSSQLKEWHS